MASKFKAKILDLFRAAKPAVATGGNGEPPAPVTEQSIIGGSNIVERNGQTYVVPRGGPRSLGSVDLTALDIHDENKPAVSRAPIQQPPHNIFEIDGEELFVGHGRVADERVASAAEIKRLIAAAEEQEIQKLQRIMERFEKTQSIPVEEMDALGKTLPIVPAAEIAALKIPADQNGAPANLPALKPTVLKIDPEKDAVILDANRFENVFFLSSKNSPAELVLYPDDINDGLAENLDQEIFVDAFNEVAAGDSSLNLEEATERERHDNIMEVALRRPRAPETRDIIIAQAEEMMLLSPEPGRHKGYNVGRGLALLTTLSAGDAVYATRQIPPLLKFISSPEPELASEAVKRNSAILLDKIMTYESHLQSLAEAKYAQDLTDKERQAKIVAATVRSMEKIAAMRAREEEEARKISDIKLTADRLFAFVSKGGLAHAVVDLRDLTDLRKVDRKSVV